MRYEGSCRGPRDPIDVCPLRAKDWNRDHNFDACYTSLIVSQRIFEGIAIPSILAIGLQSASRSAVLRMNN
jgi:hypothetical protein